MGRGRSLTGVEENIVYNVFQESLPRPFLKSRVMIHDAIGLGDRPYTSISAGIGRYEINMGDKAFDARANTPDFQAVLIHEMTHVWQAHHSFWGVAGVWASSIKCQVQRGPKNAYLYGEGNLHKDWDDFGAEEQAQIVEDWYRPPINMSITDPRFHYIRDVIRKARE